MKIINRIIPLLFLCFELVCYSQESKDTRTAIDNKEYDNFVSCQRKRNLSQFTEYRFSDEIDKMKDSDAMSGIYHALGSNFYNWIGAYSKALELASITGKNNKPNDEELSYFNMFYPVSARQNILSRIQDESLIIFNEAHDKPQHRVFVTSVLKELFNEGFELLFLEALNPNDTLINNRGYPTKTSGLYLKDPQFGNLVREALKIGFTIHPYESKTHEDDKEREYNQAKNIGRIVKESGDKKAVVYCGYDQLWKT
ncbi:MAG: hypothetical protein Tsb004_28020 [Allomuricauda sp.]